MNRFSLFILILLLALSACTGRQSLDSVSLDVLSSEFVYDSADFPSCHASTLVETEDGLLAAWFGGSYESHPDVCIYCAAYDGSRWSDPIRAAEGVVSDSLRFPCWNPVLFRLSGGEIALYYKVGPNPREWWGEYKLSTDEGKTWGPKTALPEGILGPIKNKPLGLPDGTVLYPTSVEYTPDCWRVFIERSKGDLTGWETLAIDNSGFNAIQPALFFHKGRLEMLCRTQEGVLAKASSDDFGQTWTPLQETNLQNNNSGIDGLVLKDGLRLLVCNPIRQGRNKLDVLGSYDGIEWTSLLTLEDQPEGEFSYPAIIQRENGTVDVSYTYNRRKIKHVSLLPHIN
ncbi:MAG: exo-alpha-sialidase, partial [Bacteroidales bacterium]|nr:exo-alpha-sialidase [Bacteroidales bacterium]